MQAPCKWKEFFQVVFMSWNFKVKVEIFLFKKLVSNRRTVLFLTQKVDLFAFDYCSEFGS